MKNDPWAKAFQTTFDQEMEHGAKPGFEDELDQHWVTQEMEHGARPGTEEEEELVPLFVKRHTERDAPSSVEEEEELVPMVAEKDAPPPPPPSGPVPVPYPNFGVEHDDGGQMMFDDFVA